MAGTPPQQPRFQLPEAEYLSLAPNAHIAMGGRRRHSINTGNVSFPAGTTTLENGQVLLEQPFPHGAGIYVHDAWAMFLPGDPTSELQVISTTMSVGLNSTPGLQAYQLGLPLLTTLSPGGPTVAMRDNNKLITSDDLVLISQAVPFNINPGAPFAAFFGIQWGVKNNDPTNPHSATIVAVIVYSRLDGILE